MPSEVTVQVATVDAILPHPDPETTALEIIKVQGWQLVAGKGLYTVGEKLVYVPPEVVLTDALVERKGIKYLAPGNRVHTIRLRGELSFGLTFPPDKDWPVGTNVAEYYGIEKYVPPLRFTAADAIEDHPYFIKYTSLANLRDYPHVFADGEKVIVMEKLHGASGRVALINGERMAGSYELRRKQPESDAPDKASVYWHIWEMPGIEQLVCQLAKTHTQVIVFGEVYGSKVMGGFPYDAPKQDVKFAVFDIMVDGVYQNYEQVRSLCFLFGVQTVPLLGVFSYSLPLMHDLAEGKTMLGGQTIREGVVVRSLLEQSSLEVKRKVLKYHSDSWLFKKSKHKVEDYTDQ